MQDKRASIVRALEEHSNWSDRKIAQLLGVSHPYVAKVRKDLGLSTKGSGAKGNSAQGRKSYGTRLLPTGYGKADILTLVDLLIEKLSEYYEDTSKSPDPVVAAMSKLVRFAYNVGLYSHEEDVYFEMLDSGKKWLCFNCQTPVLPGTNCSKCGASTKMYPPTEYPPAPSG